ncbi:hypothetical protein [Roseibium algae]|uniref:Acetyltransferase (GNAT) family protein n=1 Tax=Roseibium algae TaxID=3123038 RepID=A0ABU8TRQ3_9HYPH
MDYGAGLEVDGVLKTRKDELAPALPADTHASLPGSKPGSGKGTSRASRASKGFQIRLAQPTEADFRAGVDLARASHERTLFRDIPFSEDKARSIFERATSQPERYGLLYAVLPTKISDESEDAASAAGTAVSLSDEHNNSLLGFVSVYAGEYFLGEGTLIATVQTLNIAPHLSGSLLGGKVALRLVQAVRHWAKTRSCEHVLFHVTNGVDAPAADRFFRRCGMKTVGGNYAETI